MNSCYKYINLLWNLILYYDYGMNSCVSYGEADCCTLDVLPTRTKEILTDTDSLNDDGGAQKPSNFVIKFKMKI